MFPKFGIIGSLLFFSVLVVTFFVPHHLPDLTFGASQIDNNNKVKIKSDISKIHSLTINVTGQSFIGPTYDRTASLNRNEAEFILEYSCGTLRGSQKCLCKGFKTRITKVLAEEILRTVASTKDEGPAGQCCDHPYTTIVITYKNRQEKQLTVGTDLLDQFEKDAPDKGRTIFGMRCN